MHQAGLSKPCTVCSQDTRLVAVVVPYEAVLVVWAKSKGIKGGFADLCSNPAVKQYLLRELAAAAKIASLKVRTSGLQTLRPELCGSAQLCYP